MNTLKTKLITVTTGQKLSEITELIPLPTNAIFNKTVPALGATHAIINSSMNCFLMEANVPVIQGKVEDHNVKPENKDKQILGVYKGITKDDILDYLTSSARYKIILSTPEGFKDKIIPIIKSNIDYYRKNFYIMIDECEKNIQDSSYRGKINAPFDIFFDFDHKGLVSATPLEFSDPRFKEHGFTNYVIRPDYDFRQPLELITTNNVLESFKEYLNHNQANKYCIFVNSTNTIEAIIKQLGIKDHSMVFCAEESVDKLKYKELPNASSDFKPKRMKKFNFFTSRYFSAFDMILNEKPNVLMLTDVYFAKHSILDPSTEAIQIPGRLRKGLNKLTHITNFNPLLKCMSEMEAKTYLEGIRDMFKGIINLALQMPNKGKDDFLEQIKKLELARLFKDDGQYDWFMFDNFIHEERVKGYYQSPGNLIEAYAALRDHFNVSVKNEYFALGDKERLNRETADSRKTLLKEMAMQLDSMEKAMFCLNKPEAIKVLRSISDVLVDGYYTLGLDGLEDENYSENKIRGAIERKSQAELLKAPKTLAFIYSRFEIDGVCKGRYTDDKIVDTLNKIYNKVGIKKKPKASHIKIFFNAKRTTVQQTKGYQITSKKF